MKEMTIAEFHAALRGQAVECRDDLAFKCPMCETVQTAHDLIEAGAGGTFEEVEKYLGFSCVGRWTDAGPPRNTPDGQPCNWTLGGLFSLHKLEVINKDGRHHPRFEVASPEEARTHREISHG